MRFSPWEWFAAEKGLANGSSLPLSTAQGTPRCSSSCPWLTPCWQPGKRTRMGRVGAHARGHCVLTGQPRPPESEPAVPQRPPSPLSGLGRTALEAAASAVLPALPQLPDGGGGSGCTVSRSQGRGAAAPPGVRWERACLLNKHPVFLGPRDPLLQQATQGPATRKRTPASQLCLPTGCRGVQRGRGKSPVAERGAPPKRRVVPVARPCR